MVRLRLQNLTALGLALGFMALCLSCSRKADEGDTQPGNADVNAAALAAQGARYSVVALGNLAKTASQNPTVKQCLVELSAQKQKCAAFVTAIVGNKAIVQHEASESVAAAEKTFSKFEDASNHAVTQVAVPPSVASDQRQALSNYMARENIRSDEDWHRVNGCTMAATSHPDMPTLEYVVFAPERELAKQLALQFCRGMVSSYMGNGNLCQVTSITSSALVSECRRNFSYFIRFGGPASSIRPRKVL